MLKRYINILFFLLFLGIVLGSGSLPAQGQNIGDETGQQRYYWGNMGAGVSTFDLAGGVNVSYLSGNHLFSTRFVYNQEHNPLDPIPRKTIWDASALYGRSIKASYGIASISTGFGVVGGIRRGEFLGNRGARSQHEKITFLNYGIPFQSQVIWTPIRNMGLGIYGFANYNPEKSYAGILFSIQIGKLKLF